MPFEDHPWHKDVYVLRAAFTALSKDKEKLQSQLNALEGVSSKTITQLEFEQTKVKEVCDRMLKLHKEHFPSKPGDD